MTILTDEQHLVSLGIASSLLNGKHCVLSGAAGTGKTFTSGIIIEELSALKTHNVRAVAPTHKACEVLKQFVPLSCDPMTIHSALGLRPKIAPDGRELLVSNGNGKLDQFTTILVVDESSMIGELLLSELLEAADRNRFVILFIGDAYQLPPVKENQSPVYTENFPTFTLETVHRQAADNGIIQLATQIRDNMRDNKLTQRPMFNRLSDVHTYNDFDVWYDKAFEFIKEDPENNKVIAHTNDQIWRLGFSLRELIDGYTTTQPQKGEVFISNSAVVVNKDVIVPNNAECLILHSQESNVSCGAALLDTYKCVMEIRGGATKTLHVPRDFNNYKQFINYLKMNAIRRSKQGDKLGWVEFYKVVGNIVDLRPRYALTVYKSQGSTYGNVFLHMRDMEVIRSHPSVENHIMYLRALYTSVTRPSQSLHIFE